MNKLFKLLLSAFCVLTLALVLIFSNTITDSLKNGINLCLYTLIPSLFVFLVLSDLFVELKVLDIVLKPFGFICEKLFHVDSSLGPVLIMSLICGYPVGPRLLADLCAKGVISKKCAERMVCFCVNSGPAFLIGTASVPLFGSIRPGIYIFLCHIISFFCIGIITGLFQKTEKVYYKPKPLPLSSAIVNSVNSAVRAMVCVCSFVLLFCGILGVLKEFGFLDIFRNDNLNVLTIGTLEVSNGVLACRRLSFSAAFVTSAGITAFGGLCVHCQIKAIVKKSGIKLKKFFIFRLLYTLISVLSALFLYRFIDLPSYVFSASDIPLQTSAPTPFGALLLIVLSLCLLCSDKKTGIIKDNVFFKLKGRLLK